MGGWLYLIRNRDLYKIGITKNFDNRMRQLRPDSILAKLYISDCLKLEREFHKRYKKFRIPQTEYFRLDDYHLKDIKKRISKLEYPKSVTFSIFIKSLLFIIFIFSLIFIIISLNINDINSAIQLSILSMEKISFGVSIVSISLQSGKYFSFLNEIKYRISRFIFFIIFTLLFRMASIFLQ
tara:strand:+ start:502 stop:1044 length:543 start_codon:yes stop_codon:yes gene_type:complete